jgi:hypothetical protein
MTGFVETIPAHDIGRLVDRLPEKILEPAA